MIVLRREGHVEKKCFAGSFYCCSVLRVSAVNTINSAISSVVDIVGSVVAIVGSAVAIVGITST